MTPTIRKTFGASGFGATASPQSLGKPAATYPGAVATDSDMIIAVDRQQTRLALPLNALDTSMTVVDPSVIKAYNLLSIDNEIVKTTGPPAGNVVPITRAFDGTTAAVHLASAVVSGFVDAYHHNRLIAEVEAIENALGPNLSKIPAVQFHFSTQYEFAPQQPGGSLTVGTNSITLSPVPLGVNGSNVDHYLYVDQGTGTAEPVKITGGTAVSGAPSGTLFITCANAHSGAWRIQTATAGIQEAIYSAGSAIEVQIPIGSHDIHAPITIPQVNYELRGSMGGSVLNVASNFLPGAKGVFVGTPTSGNGPTVSGLTIEFIQPDSSSLSAYTHWPPAFYFQDVGRARIANVYVYRAWDVINLKGNTGGVTVENLQASHFNLGIDIDGALDSVYLLNVRFWPYDLTPNQATAFDTSPTYIALNCAKCDDLHITDFFCDGPVAMRFYQSASGQVTGSAVNVSLDSIASFKFEAGYLNITNFFISIGTFDRVAISVTSPAVAQSFLRISNLFLYSGPNIGTAQPWISQTGGDLQITASWLWSPLDHSTIVTSGGRLIVDGCLFTKQVSIAYTKPVIDVSGSARVTVIGNRIPDKGTGSGVFLSIPADNLHQIRGNTLSGWSVVYPATKTSGTYEDSSSLYYPENVYGQAFLHINTSSGIFWGNDSPNNVVTASRGSIYLNMNSAANTALWVKETGDNTNTGWVAK
jgi:hypothetical protein